MKPIPSKAEALTLAWTMAHQLCGAFNVVMPNGFRIFSHKNSKYRFKTCTISLGYAQKAYVTDVLLHELTHHIVGQYIGSHTHSHLFYTILHLVVRCYYGNDFLYSWSSEYKQGREYAGLLLEKRRKANTDRHQPL